MFRARVQSWRSELACSSNVSTSRRGRRPRTAACLSPTPRCRDTGHGRATAGSPRPNRAETAPAPPSTRRSVAVPARGIGPETGVRLQQLAVVAAGIQRGLRRRTETTIRVETMLLMHTLTELTDDAVSLLLLTRSFRPLKNKYAAFLCSFAFISKYFCSRNILHT